MNTGMIKLIYSAAYDATVDVGVRLIEDPRQLTKSASTIFGCDYSELVPDKDHLGIHLTALGDWEHYGSNRNGDSFPKVACIKYHPTFVKHGNLYRHHRNKDPEKRLGQVVKSAYNDPMGRIELFVHAHKEKARDELQRLATEGDVPFSMACKVAFDRCSICNTLRKSSSDPNQCDHVRFNLGKVGEDGKIVCTHNDEPNFFDISFVGRPADRIAWHLKAASNEIIDSVKLAEASGIWVPDYVAIVSPDATAKYGYLQKLAKAEDMYLRLSSSSPMSTKERYFWELRKAAAVQVSAEDLEALRGCMPDQAFMKLAKAGVILDVDSFFKYAMGSDYGEVAPYMPGIRQAVRGIFGRLSKQGECQDVCNEQLFDVDIDAYVPIDVSPIRKLASATLIGPECDQRVIEMTLNNSEILVDKNAGIVQNVDMTIEKLAEKYAAYKLSAVRAIMSLHKDTDTDALIAVAAAQDLVRKT